MAKEGLESNSRRRHKKVKHNGRYGRGLTTVEATHIMSDPRSGKLGTLKEDDDDETYSVFRLVYH